MSAIIVLDGMNPPMTCESCPFFDEDLTCCDILSKAANRAIRVNQYYVAADKRCPFYYLEDGHGRLLDEKDIRNYFDSMRYGDEDINFSMHDINKGLDSVLEIAPEYTGVIERLKKGFSTCGDAIKELLTSPKDIEDLIQKAAESEEESNGGKDN